ncbi:MAG: helix-turn-helix domain-containing protein [Silicimonas sp.]|jgi:transcriptional regulator with XRE-family HTH domain|nr:helix-turn-helix domain-containing protein [Silicimonas sp.]
MDVVEDPNWYTNEAATFGDRVVAAREMRGISAKTLARHMGVATKTIEGWENDTSEPRANKLQMLSGILNVSIPWLLTGEGQDFEDEQEADASADVGEMLLEVRTLRAEMLHAAERLAVLEKRIKKSQAA